MNITTHFLDAGEAALVVEFGTAVDPQINDHVLSLDEALTSLRISGVLETVPTYRSLMIHYDPLVLDREILIAKIRSIEARPHSQTRPKNCWTIPCCYEWPFSEDLNDVAEAAGISKAQVVALHSETAFRAYMYGFAPGCLYLGGLSNELAISRRPIPRTPYPANSVLIAGGLSLIGTFSMPTGWWVIGRTPVRLFCADRNPIFLLEVGDSVRFKLIDKDEFERLERRSARGESIGERRMLR